VVDLGFGGEHFEIRYIGGDIFFFLLFENLGIGGVP